MTTPREVASALLPAAPAPEPPAAPTLASNQGGAQLFMIPALPLGWLSKWPIKELEWNSDDHPTKKRFIMSATVYIIGLS